VRGAKAVICGDQGRCPSWVAAGDTDSIRLLRCLPAGCQINGDTVAVFECDHGTAVLGVNTSFSLVLVCGAMLAAHVTTTGCAVDCVTAGWPGRRMSETRGNENASAAAAAVP
jgi:hypothetical protein